MKKIALFIFALSISFGALAQIGGTKVYSFLDIPMTARAAALGGNNMSIWGDDINLIYSNPSLLNPSMTKQLTLNYSNYVSDLNYGYLAYAHAIKKQGTLAGSIQFFNYGKFTGYDELGNQTTDFKANDYSLNLTYAKPLADSMFNIGGTLKTIVSQYYNYTSVGNVIDFGVTYHNKKNFTTSLLVKNIGFVWKDYTTSNPINSSQLPRTVQLGASYKPEKAPFRIFVVYDQLLKWNLSYVSPVDSTGKSGTLGSSNTIAQDSSGFQKFSVRFGSGANNFMRHITLGTEILLTKNFNLRIAYNYRRQREMTLPERRGANGLSFGFGFKIKRFGFAYSFSKMAFPGNSSIFSVTLKF